MYHISDLKTYLLCGRLFQLNYNNQDKNYNYFIRPYKNITDLAIKKLKLDNYFLGNVSDDKDLALDAINNYEWLVKARFEYGGLRVKVPFLKRVKDSFDLYFLYVGNYPRNNDILFYSSTCWVLINNNIKLRNIYIIHLNANYVRDEELDVDKLFKITTHFYNFKNHYNDKTIRDEIFENMRNFKNNLKNMDKVLKSDLIESKKIKYCDKQCIYSNECFKDDDIIEHNSILTLNSSKEKHMMYESGIRFLRDANIDNIELTKMQYAQIMADKKGGLYFDKLALYTFLKNIKEPVSFLDFEWETYSIPPYKGMKPLDPLLFQYSLHILEDDKLIHKDFLNIKDDRLDLIKNLLNDLPKEGSIIAYNANSAEKIRLIELANNFKEYEKELLDIIDRLVDLQIPFEKGVVYDTRMRGNYSLKAIANMLDDSYKDLEIKKGVEAVFAFRKFEEEVDDKLREDRLSNLKAYCGMDSYAMVIIYKWLKNLI